MAEGHPSMNLLGLDIGRMNTRATLFGYVEGKYGLQGYGIAPTRIGPGLGLGKSIEDAVENLQEQVDRILLRPESKPSGRTDPLRLRVDQVVSVLSAGPWRKTALFGLTERGSLHAGKALLDSMPLENIGVYGIADQLNEQQIIEQLFHQHPEFLIIVGGEDTGAQEPILRWAEVARLICLLSPEANRPVILFAGNPLVTEKVRRRLEPISKLHVLPNLYPGRESVDLVPAQTVLNWEIIQKWREDLHGWVELSSPQYHAIGTTSFPLSRMVRFLSQLNIDPKGSNLMKGVMALNLGGESIIFTAGLDGRSGTLMQKPYECLACEDQDAMMNSVRQWTCVPMTKDEVHQFLSNRPLFGHFIPEDQNNLALSQAFARVQIQSAVKSFKNHYPWFQTFPDHETDVGYEPIIASGAVLTQAPTPGQVMLTILDGIQPSGITTIVLDKYHTLPILGLIGQIEPLLPVHLLASAAFKNLGTVIVAANARPMGEVILTVHVQVESGKNYSVDVSNGDLRRLVVPPGASVIVDLEPEQHTSVGFGGPGVGGRLKVIGGAVGIVIDARGRPLRLPEDDEERVARLHQWKSILGG